MSYYCKTIEQFDESIFKKLVKQNKQRFIKQHPKIRDETGNNV